MNGPGSGFGNRLLSGGGAGGEDGAQSLEPFPRQTLVGVATGPIAYYSPFYDSKNWKSVAWWFECYGCLPSGAMANPVTMYLESGESLDGPFEQLASQTAVELTRYTGSIQNSRSLLRVRVVVEANFILTVAIRIVTRWR